MSLGSFRMNTSQLELSNEGPSQKLQQSRPKRPSLAEGATFVPSVWVVSNITAEIPSDYLARSSLHAVLFTVCLCINDPILVPIFIQP